MIEDNLEMRKETLLQRFFDGDIDESEAGELLSILQRNSTWSEAARAELETEQLFRFHQDRRKTLSPARLEKLKAAVQPLSEDFDLRDVSNDFWTHWDEATFLNLVQFEKNAPALIDPNRPVPRKPSFFESWFPNKKDEKPISSFQPHGKGTRLRYFFLFFLLIGTSCLTFMGIYNEFFGGKNQSNVSVKNVLAEIDVVVDVQPGKNGKILKKGQQLRNDRIRFESGLVQLRFENGVRMVLEGPMDIRLNSLIKTICDTGKLSVYVPPAGKGFEVATPHLTVRDLGTEFVVDVSGEESAVHVVQGEIETNWFGGDWQSFGVGEAFRMNPEARKPTRFIAEPDLFVSENRIRRIATESLEKRRSEWIPQERRQQADPNLLFSLEKASTHGCRRTAGMLEELTALRFQSSKDYVDFVFGGEHRNLTLLAIVRLENMKNFSNTLCIGDGILDGPGEFLWQVDQSGAVFFHIRAEKEIQRFETAPIIDRTQWNTWMFLAVVIDGENGTVSHYLDGKKITSFPWKESLPLRMNRGTIGNKRPDRSDQTARFWNGDIDTFRIFSRAFDEKEILDLFHTMH